MRSPRPAVSSVWAEARHREAVHVAQMLIRAAWLTPLLLVLAVAAVLAVRVYLVPAAAGWVDRQVEAAVTRATDAATLDLPQLADIITGGTR